MDNRGEQGLYASRRVLHTTPHTEFPGELVNGVREKMNELDLTVVLVKFVAAEMWLVYGDGHAALAALMANGLWVSGGGALWALACVRHTCVHR
jgi:hypothetical protein